MINVFWWGGGRNNKGIRWLAWDKLACPKEEGDLGFRDFQSFNIAMVAKQGWNFMSNLTSLVDRVQSKSKKAALYTPNHFSQAPQSTENTLRKGFGS
jgi:hypothetical protein